MEQRNENYGRDQNIYNQPQNVTCVTNNTNNINNIFTLSLPSLESQEIPLARKIINYIGALLFLVAVLCWWFLLNLFTKCAFPFKRIFALIFASLALLPAPSKENKNVLSALWHELRRQVEEKFDLTQQNLEINGFNRQEYSRFNKQVKEVWLLKNLIKILTGGAESESQEVDKILEILQKQEDCIALNLEQLRKKLDPALDRIQEILNKVKEPSVETDYGKINSVLNSLVYKFILSSKSSQEQPENLLEELRKITFENSYNIDTSRIGTLLNVLQLLEWISAVERNRSFKYEFKSEIDSARKQKAIDLIVDQITEVLKGIIKDISPETLDSIEFGVRKEWLAEISIYGFNGRDLAVVELALEIDWRKFNARRNYSISDGTVKITWSRKLAIEIDRTIDHFNKFLQNNRLTPTCRVGYSPGFSEQEEEEINRILNFQNAPVHWDEQGISAQDEETRVQDLSELGVGLYFKPRKNK